SEEPLLNGHSDGQQHQQQNQQYGQSSSKRSCWRRLSMQCSSGRGQHQPQHLALQTQQQQQPDESLLSDLHNGVKCMRVLFNNQRACQRTFQDKTAVSIIARCVLHPRYATKTLVLELLAALCMLDGMHAQVLDAFDSLRERVGERRRWETLMTCFRRHEALPAEQYSLEFMVSCARFINIVQNVSNDEQLGQRVCLQAEFAQLGLEEFLRGLHGKYGDERLNSQIEAIFDNTIDVAGLFIDSVAKQAAVARAAALEEELYQTQDRQRRAEDEAAQIMAELRERLQNREADCATLQAEKERAVQQMQHSLRAASHSAGERERQLEQTVRELEARLRESESALKAAQQAAKSSTPPSAPAAPAAANSSSSSSSNGAGAARRQLPRCAATPPPPPPPPPPPGGAPPPPPPPPPPFGAAPAAPAGMQVRQPVIPKHRLPLLNWTAIPPSGCRGTVFMDMNDERARRRIDVDDFEDKFKLSANGGASDKAAAAATAAALKTKKERPTLLGHDRFRNLAVTRHKVESMRLSFADLAAAVDSLDADKVSADLAEILLRQGVPTEEEVRSYRRYEFAEGRRVDALSEQDQLLVALCRVPMLERKLQALRYAGQFEENFSGVEPPLRAVVAASMTLEKSVKFKKVLELILGLGNYLNSHKRGLTYGFRLCSLATLQDTKSGDRKWTLLHFLVELIDQHFPDLANFESDLRHCEKAASINLDNVRADASQLISGLEQLRSLAKETNSNRLRDFLQANSDRVERLKTDLKTAEECYSLVKTRFGEGMQQVASDAFFSILHRFHCDVTKARSENEQRRAAAAELERASGKRKDSEDLGQQRRTPRKHTRTIEDGALDDIMSDFSRGALLVDDGLRRKRKTARDRLPQIRSSAAAEDCACGCSSDSCSTVACSAALSSICLRRSSSLNFDGFLCPSKQSHQMARQENPMTPTLRPMARPIHFSGDDDASASNVLVGLTVLPAVEVIGIFVGVGFGIGAGVDAVEVLVNDDGLTSPMQNGPGTDAAVPGRQWGTRSGRSWSRCSLTGLTSQSKQALRDMPLEESPHEALTDEHRLLHHATALLTIGVEALLVLGNLLPPLVVFRAKSSAERTNLDLIVAALSVTDILSVLVPEPPWIVAYFRGTWQRDARACNLHQLTALWFQLASMLIVVLLVLDRARCVRRMLDEPMPLPVDTRNSVLLGCLLLTCYCLTLLTATLPLLGFAPSAVAEKSGPDGELVSGFCVSWLARQPNGFRESVFFVVFASIAGLCLACVLSTNLVIICLWQRKQTAAQKAAEQDDATASAADLLIEEEQFLEMGRFIETMRVTALISLVFCCTWIPTLHQSVRWCSNSSRVAPGCLVSRVSRVCLRRGWRAASVRCRAVLGRGCAAIRLGQPSGSRQQLVSVSRLYAAPRIDCAVASAGIDNDTFGPAAAFSCTSSSAEIAVEHTISRLELARWPLLLKLMLLSLLHGRSQRWCQEVQPAAQPAANEQLTRRGATDAVADVVIGGHCVHLGHYCRPVQPKLLRHQGNCRAGVDDKLAFLAVDEQHDCRSSVSACWSDCEDGHLGVTRAFDSSFCMSCHRHRCLPLPLPLPLPPLPLPLPPLPLPPLSLPLTDALCGALKGFESRLNDFQQLGSIGVASKAEHELMKYCSRRSRKISMFVDGSSWPSVGRLVAIVITLLSEAEVLAGLRYSNLSVSPPLVMYAQLSTTLSGVFNPLIYAVCSHSYREGYLRVFCGCCCCCRRCRWWCFRCCIGSGGGGRAALGSSDDDPIDLPISSAMAAAAVGAPSSSSSAAPGSGFGGLPRDQTVHSLLPHSASSRFSGIACSIAAASTRPAATAATAAAAPANSSSADSGSGYAQLGPQSDGEEGAAAAATEEKPAATRNFEEHCNSNQEAGTETGSHLVRRLLVVVFVAAAAVVLVAPVSHPPQLHSLGLLGHGHTMVGVGRHAAQSFAERSGGECRTKFGVDSEHCASVQPCQASKFHQHVDRICLHQLWLHWSLVFTRAELLDLQDVAIEATNLQNQLTDDGQHVNDELAITPGLIAA
uniref:FH2 domain-containing protein n=1 Tax=Macrostomum lignano TaxID=282301 RepID=A0A1I8IIZ2_9PLAT